jgi:hypothetical protein
MVSLLRRVKIIISQVMVAAANGKIIAEDDSPFSDGN